MNKLNLILIFFIAFFPSLLFAQGWEKTYDGLQDARVTAADKTLDGGVIMTGTQTDSNNVEYSFLHQTDADGNLLWEYYDILHPGTLVNTFDVLSTSDGNFLLSSLYGFNLPLEQYVVQKIAPDGNVIWENGAILNNLDYVTDMVETSDGEFILAGISSTSQTVNSAAVIKIDTDGNVIWNQIFAVQDIPFQVGGLMIAANGDVLLSGYLGYFSTQDAFVKRLDSNTGNVIWEKEYDNAFNDFAFGMIELANGDFVISGSFNQDFSPTIASLLKIDASGNQVWYQEYYSLQGQVTSGEVQKTSDGGFVFGGSYSPTTNGVSDIYLLKTDADGNEIWTRNYGRSKSDYLGELLLADNGGFYLAGYTQNQDNNHDAYLIKTDTLGFSLTNELSGNLFIDENLNCTLENPETGLRQWLIEVEKDDAHYSTLTDSLGNYSFTLGTGTYQMNTYPISPYWNLCDSSFTIDFASTFETITQDIPAQVLIECPLLDVSVGAPFVRRCFENYYTVQYCNYGTVVAEDAYVVVTVDPFMVATYTSIPPSSITGGVNYTFEIGDVGVGECGTIKMDLLLATPLMPCDSIPLGATHCVEAHIYPDSICMPNNNWSGASVEVDALCSGDSISFIITNVGNAATQSDLNYIVVEDNVVLFQGSFNLNPNESETVAVETNGSTFRLEVEQEPNHPGMSMPNVSVENCGNSNSTFSFGFINIFAQDDGDPFVDIDCQENIGAFDPNDKRGFPLGYGDENYISRGQDIEYMIRFQNTGTDTAFTVVIKDELSELLDLTKLRPGASSHPYEFNVSGNRELSFTFNNIMLPDSNINEPASHGFVKFKVAQMPNLDLETKIHNSAAIYFDFNAPIITNQTLHTLGENLITVSIDNPIGKQLADVKIYPNPFSDVVNVEVKDLEIKNGAFKLYDATGRLLRQQNFNNNDFTFHKKDLRTGMYFFTIENNGQLISSGKLIAQ